MQFFHKTSFPPSRKRRRGLLEKTMDNKQTLELIALYDQLPKEAQDAVVFALKLTTLLS